MSAYGKACLQYFPDRKCDPDNLGRWQRRCRLPPNAATSATAPRGGIDLAAIMKRAWARAPDPHHLLRRRPAGLVESRHVMRPIPEVNLYEFSTEEE